MKTRRWRIENGGWQARSVLECGSPLPLLNRSEDPTLQSARVLAQSKTWRIFGTLLTFFTITISVHAQSYSIDWYKIAGGGGTSTGGTYQVSGTIGQPDAGTMSGGNYTLQGGFWALPAAVQTPGAPLLSIAASGPGQATISWLPATPGFVLQENLSLTTTNWVDSPSGATNPIIVPATLPTKFYRLRWL